MTRPVARRLAADAEDVGEAVRDEPDHLQPGETHLHFDPLRLHPCPATVRWAWRVWLTRSQAVHSVDGGEVLVHHVEEPHRDAPAIRDDDRVLASHSHVPAQLYGAVLSVRYHS